ncbi:hypothetical protein PLUTE_a4364 [Pseudoalteromonas luteoviolacea DSM 6061]|nr:hypothetical protein [Pseudoalteromonas luteoviolacea DSM 6061]
MFNQNHKLVDSGVVNCDVVCTLLVTEQTVALGDGCLAAFSFTVKR